MDSTTCSELAAPGPVLDLQFSDAWELDADLDPTAWSGDEPDELLDAPSCAADIPVDDTASSVDAWNLGASLRRLVTAAAMVPLLLSAAPAHAAPPGETSMATPRLVPGHDALDPSTIWSALQDRRVVVTLADGSSFRGTVLSANEAGLVCAREGDGLLVHIDASRVVQVNVEGLPGTPAPKQAQTGSVLITLGSIATVIGGALGIATGIVAASCIDANRGYYDSPYACPYITMPLGLVGAANLAAGIPMLAVGLSKRKKHRAQSQPGPILSGFALPTRQGVMAGATIRF